MNKMRKKRYNFSFLWNIIYINVYLIKVICPGYPHNIHMHDVSNPNCLIQMINSENLLEKNTGLILYCEQIECDNYPNIEKFLTNGSIPFIINFMETEQMKSVIINSSQALVMLAAGRHQDKAALIKAGAVKIWSDFFLECLNCETEFVRRSITSMQRYHLT